nr:amidohydrolase family protein [Myxococcota bacterium]
PFGACDPWAAMRAAVQRRTAGGEPMRLEEALAPERALALFTSSLEAPGRPRGPLAPGQDADLVLLDRPWQAARRRLNPADVRATLAGGKFIWQRDPQED